MSNISLFRLATATFSGIVSVVDQSFAGIKTFTSGLKVSATAVTALARIAYQSAINTNAAMIQHTIASTANYAIGVDSSNTFVLGNLSAADTWDKKALVIMNSGTVSAPLGFSVPTAAVASTNVYSGSWNATVSGAVNVDGGNAGVVVIGGSGTFMRVGNMVTAGFTANIDPTTAANTVTSFEFTLPVTTTTSQSQNVNGVIATGESTLNTAGVIKGVTGTSRGKAAFRAQTSSNDEYKIHFSYLVE